MYNNKTAVVLLIVQSNTFERKGDHKYLIKRNSFLNSNSIDPESAKFK